MKIKFGLLLSVLMLVVLACNKSTAFPGWINGTWHNSMESNTNNFVFLTFKNDSLFIMNGLPKSLKWKGQSLNEKYRGYEYATKSDSSYLKLSFEKKDSLIVYNFKLTSEDFSKDQLLTYSITVNGVVVKAFANTALTKFTKLDN